jgi:hypothetical protein
MSAVHARSTERLSMFAAGAAATVVMTAASRVTTSHVIGRLTELLGTLVARPGTGLGVAFGHGAQIVNGGLFAMTYDEAFRRAGDRLNPIRGLAVGLVHGLAAGLLLAATPAIHPRVPEVLPDPGPFMRRHGRDAALALIALHGLYGALVGAAASVLRPIPRGEAG